MAQMAYSCLYNLWAVADEYHLAIYNYRAAQEGIMLQN